ncbi:hypothetical protein MyNCGM70_18900 [Achromobacter xylosoxidans]
MLPSMTHSMLTGHLKWFENQTGNRPPDRLNSNSNSIMQNHREQASTTSLQVRGLRHRPYTVNSVKGGVQMVLTPPTDGSSPDRQVTQSLCAITSVKP